MQITQIVYLGPHASKSVSGVGEFKKGVPMAVLPHKAKSILAHWPGLFAAVLPCEHCAALAPQPVPAPEVIEETPAETEPPVELEDVTEDEQDSDEDPAPKKGRGRRGAVKADE